MENKVHMELQGKRVMQSIKRNNSLSWLNQKCI